MYPVRLGYDTAIKRINRLIHNGHHAEALVTSMFTVEKTLRRTLRQIIVSAGFTSKSADKIISKINGMENLKEAWALYDPMQKKLTEIIEPKDWLIIKRISKMRNEMVHGIRVYELDTCKMETENLLQVLDRVKTKLDVVYGYSGWEKFKIRKTSKLHTDPKIRINGEVN
jgi:hypothetical protein